MTDLNLWDLYSGREYTVRIVRQQYGTEVDVAANDVEVAVAVYLDTVAKLAGAPGYSGATPEIVEKETKNKRNWARIKAIEAAKRRQNSYKGEAK